MERVLLLSVILILTAVQAVQGSNVNLPQSKFDSLLQKNRLNFEIEKKKLILKQEKGQSGIVGGEDAYHGEFKHQVALLWGGADFGVYYCGGSLIQNDWILTAAHCCTGDENSPENIGVIVGSLHMYQKDEDQQTIAAKRVIIHEDFDSFSLENDICLIQLERQVILGDYVEAIDLPPRNQTEQYYDGINCTVTGWGATSEGGNLSDVLQKVNVTAVPDEVCRDKYGENEISDSMLCAGQLDNGGKDACQGDSGGPLICGNELSGIVSWGEGCARPGKPGVYTQTYYFLDWIEVNMQSFT